MLVKEGIIRSGQSLSVTLAIRRHPLFFPLRAERGLSGGTGALLPL